MNQVIYNMFVTKDLDDKVLEFIYAWGETISSRGWKISASFLLAIEATPIQSIVSKYMIFSLVSVIEW